MENLKEKFNMLRYRLAGDELLEVDKFIKNTNQLWQWITENFEPKQQVKVEPDVKPANDGNKIRWFMELALKMRELNYSDTSIYSIDIDAWDEYRVDAELTPQQAITEDESNA